MTVTKYLVDPVNGVAVHSGQSIWVDEADLRSEEQVVCADLTGSHPAKLTNVKARANQEMSTNTLTLLTFIFRPARPELSPVPRPRLCTRAEHADASHLSVEATINTLHLIIKVWISCSGWGRTDTAKC